MTSSISTWSVHHPIGVVMLTLAVMVLGAFALGRLNVDLLPRIIYPTCACACSTRACRPG
jgi:multidrug efflux pump subunit AcrB